MGQEREVPQPSSKDIRMPWRWNDPLSWVIAVLFALGFVLMGIDLILRARGGRLEGLWAMVPLFLANSALLHRKANYLQERTGCTSQVTVLRSLSAMSLCLVVLYTLEYGYEYL